MRRYGFSTGALAKGDVKKALHMSEQHHTDAVEYSALRMEELEPLADYLFGHGVGHYHYMAFHAPSQFDEEDEEDVVKHLEELVRKFGLHVVVHPDVIHDHSLWRRLGNKLCVENMDHRKPIGRTAEELDSVFQKLPQARLCFDIGHAHEVDRSMSRAYEILKRYRNRIAHIHASEVSDECVHHAFSPTSAAAFSKLVNMIPDTTPIILETVTPDEQVGEQLTEAKTIFGHAARHPVKRKMLKR